MPLKNDHVEALNYCAHAIEDLRATAAVLAQPMPQSARVLYRLVMLLQNSVKFILPNCCNLVAPDELRQTHLDMLRLPFPCVAFEVPWDKDEIGPDYIGDFKQSPMTKRIALCWDGRQFEPLPGLNVLLDTFADGGAFVLPIYWGPEHKRWTVALGGVFVPYGSSLKQLDLDLDLVMPASKIANAAKIAAGHAHPASMHIPSEPFPILPEFYQRAIATYGSRAKADAQIIIDGSDELQVLIQACSVINCANVTTADVHAPSALNKKRRASGKQPFFTYKVLALHEERHTTGKPGAIGQHASPRMHLRRGHLRQLEHKVVWVRPALINAESKHGVVHKDYRVREAG